MWPILFGGGVGMIVLDRYTKYLAEHSLHQTVYLIGDWFTLQLHYNSWVAFGLPLKGLPQIIITGILIAGILWILWTQRTKMILSEKLGYGAILAGALSNGMDRLLYGRVVDFLSLKYFAIFNVADIVISIGACLLVVSSLYLSRYAIHDSRRASRTTENR